MGYPSNTRCHPTPFALDFIPSTDDNSNMEDEAKALLMETECKLALPHVKSFF